jgi:hypothetical protein
MFLAMIVASAALTKYEVGAQVEACFQNFAAGLILAAGKYRGVTLFPPLKSWLC